MLTSAEASSTLGLTRTGFRKAAARHNVEPVRALAGLRGAMLWDADDIERLRTLLTPAPAEHGTSPAVSAATGAARPDRANGRAAGRAPHADL